MGVGLPLEGTRILDLTRLLPGAYCSLLLADLGADVVKLENPDGGDYLRWMPPFEGTQSVLFDALNRNKRSLTLDLKAAAGAELFRDLVSRFDVLIEGNRPGAMDRLGVGWGALHAHQPKLVMCSITGYGQEGELAQKAGHDLNYMALIGALSLNGAPAGPPHPYGLQVADFAGGGLGAAVAILAALFGVNRGGQGRHLDVSMSAGVLAWLAPQLAQVRQEGKAPERGRDALTGRYPCYRVYECADGRHYSVAALEPKFWHALCAAVERPDLIPLQFAEGDDGRRAHAEMEGLFRSRSRDEWQQLLAGEEVCCEPVLELDEVLSRRVASGEFVETENGLEVAPALRLGNGGRRRPAPSLGQHTGEILAEIGVTEARLTELRSASVI